MVFFGGRAILMIWSFFFKKGKGGLDFPKNVLTWGIFQTSNSYSLTKKGLELAAFCSFLLKV